MSETMDDAPHHGKKGKKEPSTFIDKSTPSVDDTGLAAWIERLFRGDERADRIMVKQLLGRNGRMEGAVIKTHTFPHGEPPAKETIVSLANEIVAEMQDEADNHRTPRMFAIEAYNAKKGAGVISRITRWRDPTGRLSAMRGGGGGGEDDDLEYGPGGDRLLRRVETLLADGQWHSSNMTQTFGDFAKIVTEENRELRTMVHTLMEGWLGMAKQKNEADNNALDREIIRDEKKFWLEQKRRGFRMAEVLLPDLFSKLGLIDGEKKAIPQQAASTAATPSAATTTTAATPTAAPTGTQEGRTQESLALDAVIDSLSKEERAAVFGEWSDEGQRLSAGILSAEQVLLLHGLKLEEVPVEQMSRLLAGGDLTITRNQFVRIAASADISKFKPILSLMEKRWATQQTPGTT